MFFLHPSGFPPGFLLFSNLLKPVSDLAEINCLQVWMHELCSIWGSIPHSSVKGLLQLDEYVSEWINTGRYEWIKQKYLKILYEIFASLNVTYTHITCLIFPLIRMHLDDQFNNVIYLCIHLFFTCSLHKFYIYLYNVSLMCHHRTLRLACFIKVAVWYSGVLLFPPA